MNIAIVGAGNVAWHVAQGLQATGNAVTAVYSRTLTQASELTNLLPGAVAKADLDFRDVATDVILIAVPDAAIFSVANQLKITPGSIVAHTSGSQPISVLGSIDGADTGVFYPLQTFSKQAPVNLQQVPILVEGSTEQATQKLEQLAQSISTKVEHVTSEKRKQLHLAAVFACNFTNHLLGISQELLQKADLTKDLLQPLIQETITKAATHNPFTVQTGPAIRGDKNVIEDHLQLLENNPLLQSIYQQLTQSIQEKKLS
ncbi:Rossmann-like and DUF2520 domain-containing protein [Pontibacter sp. H259]|uniref:Rossmann-like and DUF2520 domain-containing protein n=1 Tax=Pontibacter sp. H259 TaxID=3133421 RepID=UPI0030C0AB59